MTTYYIKILQKVRIKHNGGNNMTYHRENVMYKTKWNQKFKNDVASRI